MNRFRLISLKVWLLLRDIPPFRMERLLMSAVFLAGWTVLSLVGVEAKTAFVLSFVLAQMAQIWIGLPRAARDEWRRHGTSSGTQDVSVLIFLIFAVQVLWAEPWLSQRLLSAACAIWFVTMVMGVRGNQWVLDSFAAVSEPTDVTMIARKHYLKLRALMAFLVLVVNETLMLIDAPLASRVAVLALLPMAIHVLFQVALILTTPLDDDPAPGD